MREDEAPQNLFADEDQRDAASQICRRTRTASVFLLSSCVASQKFCRGGRSKPRRRRSSFCFVSLPRQPCLGNHHSSTPLRTQCSSACSSLGLVLSIFKFDFYHDFLLGFPNYGCPELILDSLN
ncbi:hypothetical protein SLEP1_g57669 [Rubroshorea leprosula]|uniref:Uncharacterized protein n=1 Tax=Rubroshorea leprosula TaxID=152421 RepID=A0AAV5MLW0_9ROSI|nr:hypothetical protein SLEP1_g57669 [Rubroshorea leprosula]